MLNDRGYFWQAREILEAMSPAAPQGGRERILRRASILVANANLRLRMETAGSAFRLLGEALGQLRAFGHRLATACGDGCRRLSDRGAGGEAEGAARAAYADQGHFGDLGYSADHETKCIFLRFLTGLSK
jgi:hypothetical protein